MTCYQIWEPAILTDYQWAQVGTVVLFPEQAYLPVGIGVDWEDKPRKGRGLLHSKSRRISMGAYLSSTPKTACGSRLKAAAAPLRIPIAAHGFAIFALKVATHTNEIVSLAFGMPPTKTSTSIPQDVPSSPESARLSEPMSMGEVAAGDSRRS
jgi:hypothetical protein